MSGTAHAAHLPALDGLRALAVAAVVAFHLGCGWMPGGFVGVSLFFTLSGFLITRLLLGERAATGRIDLAAFWGRRVRRLLPAALVTLAGVLAIAPRVLGPVDARRVPGDVLAAVTSVANWRFAAGGESYADLFTGRPSPVLHFWSLAIEEQFYVIYPVVVAAALWTGRRLLPWVLAGLVAASVVTAVVTAGRDLGYYGTHVRAAELLLGGLLAVVLARPGGGPGNRSRPAIVVAGPAALAGFVVLAVTTDQNAAWLYRGGFAAVAALVWCPMIAAAAAPGRFAAVLGAAPLVAVGRRSYGIYLVHWPVIVLFPALGRPGQIAVTTLVTEASYRLVERPVRTRRVLASAATCRFALASAVAVVAVWALATPLERGPAMTFVDPPSEPQLLSAAAAPQRVPSAPPSVVPAAPPPPPTVRVAVLGAAPALAAAVRRAGLPGVSVDDATETGCRLIGNASLASDALACPTGRGRRADIVVVGVGDGDRDALAATADAAGDRTPELVRLYPIVDATFAELAELAPRVIVVDDVTGELDVPEMLHRSLYKVALGSTTMTVHTYADVADALRAAVPGTDDLPDQRAALRVMVIGDSTAYAMAAGLARSGLPIDVLWAGRAACPLVPAAEIILIGEPHDTTDCPTLVDWTPSLEEFRPDVVLAMSSIAEPTLQRYADDPEWYAPGSAEYARQHSEGLARLQRATRAVGARIVLATAPVAPSEGPEWVSDAHVATWNWLVEQAAATHDDVELVDYAQILGEQETAVGASLRPDGAHVDDVTAIELATTVGAALLADLSPTGRG